MLGGVSACGGPEPSVVTSTVVETVVITATPDRVPNGECQAPVVGDFKVEWQRRFGPGIPAPWTDGPRPDGYFEVYTSKQATVELFNPSPHRIYTRGIYYLARWPNLGQRGRHDFSDYNPGRGLPSNPPGYVPKESSMVTLPRDAEYVDSGDSIRFDRAYSNLHWDGILNRDGITVRSYGPPETWIQSVDWWFADPEVRKRCGQPDFRGESDHPPFVPETTTGSPPR